MKKIISNKREKEVRLVLQLFLVAIPMFTLFKDWIIVTRMKDYFVLMYGIILGYIIDGNTTSPLEYDEKEYQLHRSSGLSGVLNARIIKFMIIVLCFVGMVRYVAVFDGGVLWNFTSFITQGVSIFN